MSDPEPKFGRMQPDGTFRPDDKYIRDGGIEHSADMTRLFNYSNVARDAEYLARVAVGQDPLNPVKDKRRVKRPRVVEDLLKRLCWLNKSDSMMKKKDKPWLFGADGERWITRRELEHLGCKRAWGGKYSEDQMDAALEALASVDIIKRNKIYTSEKKTSIISIRLCPEVIMRILAERKRAKQSAPEKPSRERAKPTIAADLIFLKHNFGPDQAIFIGERIRAASAELYYESSLNKYLPALAANIKGLPYHVPDDADRRKVVEDTVLVEFLKLLLQKWLVNPEDHEFRQRPMSFTLDSWRAFSHDELKATGFTEAQIVRCRGLLVTSEFLEWAHLPSPGKNEPRIYARLRVDQVLRWIREFELKGRYSGLPRETIHSWIPSVIDPRSIGILNSGEGKEESQLPGGRRLIKNKVEPAKAGLNSFSLKRLSENHRDALIRSPLASGNHTFQSLTGLFKEIFFEFFDYPETPFTHKIAAVLRNWANHGAISKKMTIPDLVKWQYSRDHYYSTDADDWYVYQTPKDTKAMLKMLGHWPGIKRLLYENPDRLTDFEAQVPLGEWTKDALVACKDKIDSCKNVIQAALKSGHRISLLPGEQWLLPHLVALYELGLQDQLAEYINLKRAELITATHSFPHLAVAIHNRYPDLMRELNLPPEHWSRLREKLQRDFHNIQVRKAQNSLDENPLGDLKSDGQAEDAPRDRPRKAPDASQPRNRDEVPLSHAGTGDFQATPGAPDYVPLRYMPKLNAAMGGGFYFGDATMVAGINASGKTVLAMQMADDFATQGYRTLVFTTERQPSELFLRCVSNRLNINMTRLIGVEPYDNQLEATSQGYIPAWVYQNEVYQNDLLKLENSYGANLRFKDWSHGRGHNIVEHFDVTMKQIETDGWVPQIIIYDWLGGGFDYAQNANQIPRLFQAAAEHLINYARQTNRIVIMCAQLNKEVVTGRTDYVDMNMVAECKGMTNGLANFIGITSLSSVTKGEYSGSVHLDRQKLCLAKAKHGISGVSVPVKTVFQYQRFEEDQ